MAPSSRGSQPPPLSGSLAALAALFAVSGVLHLMRPRPFERIVPRFLPARHGLVYVSGGAELVCAAGLVTPRTRRVAGLAGAALLAAVFPANIQMTADVLRRGSTTMRVAALARLPVQLPMIRTAWRAWRS